MQTLRSEARSAARRIEENVHDMADAAKDVGDRAAGAYANVAGKTRDVADQVNDAVKAIEPFVRTRPYLAVSLAVIAGFLLAVVYLGRGPKVIYVKPKEA
jgi:ElaB/YqjD/DUF883 family membrane-anchored ribosome-binding protein